MHFLLRRLVNADLAAAQKTRRGETRREAAPVGPGIGNCPSSLERLPLDPAVVAPIAAALVFTPREPLTRTPTPRIRMNDDARLGRILVRGGRMPTDVAAADNRCRCTRCG